MRSLFAMILVLVLVALAQAATGLVAIKSPHSVTETADRLEAALQAKGMTVFNRIDHAAGAASVGAELRPTQLVIFGNPKVGTPLLQCDQTVGIDLPQKALIWQDAAGQTWFAYNDPHYLAERHQLQGCQEVIDKVAGALNNFARAATQP
ncbi:MAG TPA: DUF302 domain-containing protein [Geothermobacteraceae bacterium]|nr:DUF302 domain-containing protein [Geothermobacteraceae bacterium]